jgi:phospholipid/cholesterol/gamma-HCH transport system permease protein
VITTATATKTVTKPVKAVGSFYALCLDTFVAIPRRPFAWRELIAQTWFVARVSLAPCSRCSSSTSC